MVPAELPRLARVLTAAFATDPVSDWLFDGEQDSHHPAFFGAFLRLAAATGWIEQSVDGLAVAVWIDRTGPHPVGTGTGLRRAIRQPDGTVAGFGCAEPFPARTRSESKLPVLDAASRFERDVTTAVGAHRERWQALQAAMEAVHPGEPHWWLVFLGVLPGQHNQGHGRRLLEHARTWQGASPAYLEATSRRLTGYYTRDGYQARAAIQIPDGPVLHPMWYPAPGH